MNNAAAANVYVDTDASEEEAPTMEQINSKGESCGES